jgi:hypothetical protein
MESMPIASSIAVAVLVVASTVFVVVTVLGLHVWGAIQDGRQEEERSRRGGRPGR